MRFLFVTDKYYPNPLANAVCVQNVAEELARLGHEVDILAQIDSGIEAPEELNGVTVRSIVPSLQYRLFYYGRNHPEKVLGHITSGAGSALMKTKKILMLPRFPQSSISFPRRLCKMIEAMNSERGYDAVITAFAPFDAALAGYMLKKRGMASRWCMYMLDTPVAMRASYLPKRLQEGDNWLPRFLSLCDLAIVMESRRGWFESKGYVEQYPCIEFADIPLLKRSSGNDSGAKEAYDFGGTGEHWVYAGSACAPHYRFDYLIDLFGALPSDEKRTLHFFSGGDGYDEVKKLAQASSARIECHGYLPHDELVSAIDAADVLVSVKYSDQISAKIFEYIDAGKPVLHISGSNKDPNISYIEKYSKGCVIHSSEPVEINRQKTVSWLAQMSSEDNTSLRLDEVFERNRPGYTANLIMKAV